MGYAVQAKSFLTGVTLAGMMMLGTALCFVIASVRGRC